MADWDMTPEEFERLLSWLDPDRTRAGERYLGIRRRLALFFLGHANGFPWVSACLEEMSDDCIIRVARKLPEIKETYQGPPEYYFLGVARNVLKEWERKMRPRELPVPEGISPERERMLECLDDCLSLLDKASRELVLEYYQHEKRVKIDHRAALAARFDLALNALRIRAHRIRQKLERCVLECARQPVGDVV